VIFLLGFMGSGKTSVGRRLAEILDRPFEDLDSRIEAAAGRTIADIFQSDGEAEFRRRETQVLSALLSETHPESVVALGGGTFVQAENRRLIEASGGVTIFLECPLEQLITRCSGLEHRPLFQDPETFRKLYEQRLPVYAQAAMTVSTYSSTPRKVAETIAAKLAEAL
jgi:shikimate kinase